MALVASDFLNWNYYMACDNMFLTCFLQMKLQGEKTGRKGHLSVATEVGPLGTFNSCLYQENFYESV